MSLQMSQPSALAKLQSRLFFVDNLRTFLIALVILDHLAITYGSPSGSWYYQEGSADMLTSIAYLVFQGVVQAFSMGLLFLLSAYFTPPSYDRKGGSKFMKDRLIRLGIPMIVFVGFIEPAVDYVVALTNGTFHGSFLAFLGKYIFFGFGIFWFVLALLIFTLVYSGWRRLESNPTKAHPFPKNKTILAFALLLGAVSFAVRLVFPIGFFSPLFSFQYAFFPQYIALFIIGVIAYRSNWLMTIPKETGTFWSKIAITLLVILAVFSITTITTGGLNSLLGGQHWQAAVYAFSEQLFGVSACIGLIVWFRERLNYQNRVMKALSDSSFTAYMIQVPVLVFLALSFRSFDLPLFVKFVITSPIGVALCFMCAYLVKRIPKMDRVL